MDRDENILGGRTDSVSGIFDASRCWSSLKIAPMVAKFGLCERGDAGMSGVVGR